MSDAGHINALRAEHLVDGRLSPDGRFTVLQICESDVENESQSTTLWWADNEKRVRRQVTDPATQIAAPCFSNDDGTIWLLSNASSNGTMQVCKIPNALDPEIETVSALEQGVLNYAIAPGGDRIAISAFAELPTLADSSPHIRVTKAVHKVDGLPGYLPELSQALYVLDIHSGEVEMLTPSDGLIVEFAWSPDGEALAYTVAAEDAKADMMSVDLNIIDAQGKTCRILNDYRIGNLIWTNDSQRLVFSGSKAGEFSTQPQLWLINRDGSDLQSRTAHLDLPVGALMQINGPTAMSPARILPLDGTDSVLAPVCRGGRMIVMRISLNGEEAYQEVIGGEQIVKPLDIRGERLLVSAQDIMHPPQPIIANIKSDWVVEGLESLGSDVQVSDNGRVEHLFVQNSECSVEGWVLLPNGRTGPHKTVLYIHGGPHAAFGYAYNEDFHALAEAGYAVAFANPRGSTGYGDAFSKAILGRWGQLEQVDLNEFLDELIARKISDPGSIGVTGFSGGGHLSAWMACCTSRFQAVVAEQGIYNFLSFWGTSDAGVTLLSHEFGGTPQTHFDLYWKFSPISHASKCQTPTLLIQGEDDLRCPMEQAEQMFTELKRAGCRVELLRMRGCNHGMTVMGPPTLRKSRLEAVLDWFDQHL